MRNTTILAALLTMLAACDDDTAPAPPPTGDAGTPWTCGARSCQFGSTYVCSGDRQECIAGCCYDRTR